MAREKSPQRLRACELYLESGGKKKLHLIAEEIGVSEATVRSWKKRDDWSATQQGGNCNVANVAIERSETNRNEKPAKKKSGAQPGNRNAVGNKGGKGNPAPKGNKYAVVTGEHESILFNTFTESEMALALSAPLTHKEMLITEHRLAVVREHRILRRIESAQRSAERGMIPASVSIESYSQGEGKTTTTKRSNTSHESLDERITRLEDALTRVQEYIRRLAAQLHKFHYDDERLEFERQKVLQEPPKQLEERTAAENGGLTIAYDYGGSEDGG